MAFPAIILLDTNIASFAIRGQSPTLNAWLQRAPLPRLCISAITEAELRYGVALNPAAKGLAYDVTNFLRRVESLPWDNDAAECYGRLRAELRKAGTPLDAMDLLIAAHALSLGALLITNDQSFTRVKGLHLADWTKTD